MSGGHSRGVVCWKESEKDFGIDRGSSSNGVAVGGEIADEGEVEHAVEVPVEMSLGHHDFERDEDGAVEITGLGRTEHGTLLRDESKERC
jgi:hypothetical protein